MSNFAQSLPRLKTALLALQGVVVIKINWHFNRGRALHWRPLHLEIRRVGRILLDVGLSGLCFLLAMMLRLGLSEIEDGQLLLVNLPIFSGVCLVVYFVTGLSLRSWHRSRSSRGFPVSKATLSSFLVRGQGGRAAI
jgi:hypothetical protein